jgi:hypothetical protein
MPRLKADDLLGVRAKLPEATLFGAYFFHASCNLINNTEVSLISKPINGNRSGNGVCKMKESPKPVGRV